MAGEIKSVFVDTNVFLRLILEDVASQQAIVQKIFEDGALGKINLNSSIIVFFEIYWVLKSSCDIAGVDLVEKLRQVLRLTVRFERHELLSKSVESMPKLGFDLEDSYNANYSDTINVDKFITFDQKLTKIIGK